VPDVDYIPLFALLGSELTDSEVSTIAEELANGGPACRSPIPEIAAPRDVVPRVGFEPTLYGF
jgi:hypothetical protein